MTTTHGAASGDDALWWRDGEDERQGGGVRRRRARWRLYGGCGLRHGEWSCMGEATLGRGGLGEVEAT